MTTDWGAFTYTSPKPDVETRACNCVGPRPGEPLCPCMMRGVTIKDGRYVKEIDYGPASIEIDREFGE